MSAFQTSSDGYTPLASGASTTLILDGAEDQLEAFEQTRAEARMAEHERTTCGRLPSTHLKSRLKVRSSVMRCYHIGMRIGRVIGLPEESWCELYHQRAPRTVHQPLA